MLGNDKPTDYPICSVIGGFQLLISFTENLMPIIDLVLIPKLILLKICLLQKCSFDEKLNLNPIFGQ